MNKDTNNDVVAAAILAAGFTAGQRQALSGGVLEETLKEKYLEFLAFIRERETGGPPAKSAPRARTRGSRGSQRKK